MAARRIVLDANIVARAVLGVRARGLIERYATDVTFFLPETAIAEVQEHLPAIFRKRQLSVDQPLIVLERLRSFWQELPPAFYADQEPQARSRLAGIDPDDWSVLACALVLDCPIWTEDRDFFGTGVATWTSDRVELFLCAPA